jgi:hypothetical protein
MQKLIRTETRRRLESIRFSPVREAEFIPEWEELKKQRWRKTGKSGRIGTDGGGRAEDLP